MMSDYVIGADLAHGEDQTAVITLNQRTGDILSALGEHIRVPSFEQALRDATRSIACLMDKLCRGKSRVDHEKYLRRTNRAHARSARNQPSAYPPGGGYYLDEVVNISTHNRKRNRHGRVGVAR